MNKHTHNYVCNVTCVPNMPNRKQLLKNALYEAGYGVAILSTFLQNEWET